MITLCHYSHHTVFDPPNSRQYKGVIPSKYHQGGTPCQQQSKFVTQPLMAMGLISLPSPLFYVDITLSLKIVLRLLLKITSR